MSDPRTPLRTDDRGAVMVSAVFLAAFLVGVLWYLIGIGDAIVYRETMQDGADATAFAAAVYHARGMNVIAMLNLIMAAVLAVLVALKIAQVLLVITNTISCALAWTGVGAAVCAATTEAEPQLQTTISDTEKVVDEVLRGLHGAADAVAVGMPWVAQAKAVAVAHDYAPTVHGGFIVSASLVPGVDLGGGEASSGASAYQNASLAQAGSGAGGGASEPAGGAEASGGAEPSGGSGRLGLPVQDDAFYVLCGHAGLVVADVVLSPFDALGIPTSWAKGFVKNLVETFPGYFCGGSGQGFQGGMVDRTAEEVCKSQQEEIAKWNASHKTPRAFDRSKCLADAKKSAGKSYGRSKAMSQAPRSMQTVDGKASKMVYEPAKNGDDYFGIWSLVWGDLKSQSGAQKGVDVAAWNRAKTSDPGFLTKSSFAKAEFYYDVKGEGGGRPAWGDYKDDAMWNLRWRARLRRVKPPVPKLGAIAAFKIGEHINDYMTSWLGDSGAAHAAIDWVKGWPEKVADRVDDKVKETIGASARDHGYFTVVH